MTILILITSKAKIAELSTSLILTPKGFRVHLKFCGLLHRKISCNNLQGSFQLLNDQKGAVQL
jgi:hypothetical protein